MSICYYNDIVLRQMLMQIKLLDNQIGVLHPALLQLLSIDQSSDTEYFQTLKTYLLEDRSMSKSARLLNIHLNTMKYRMQKIIELTGINLDDENVRIHLLLSVLIYEY